jgi:hypothetical protein
VEQVLSQFRKTLRKEVMIFLHLSNEQREEYHVFATDLMNFLVQNKGAHNIGNKRCRILWSLSLQEGRMNKEQRTKNKEQRTKNKEQRTKNKEQRTKKGRECMFCEPNRLGLANQK